MRLLTFTRDYLILLLYVASGNHETAYPLNPIWRWRHNGYRKF